MCSASSYVVIADDQADLADLLGEVVRSFGFEVGVCYDGLSARELIATHRPGAALLDVSMPGMSGYELASWLRGETWGQTMRLLAFTGHSSENEQLALREAGFDDVLLKPLGVEALRRALQCAAPA